MVPSKFRNHPDLEGESGFYALIGPGPYILLYTATEWDRISQRISRAASDDGDVFEKQRAYFAEVEYLPLDKQGRVSLPSLYVQDLGIGNEVAILGSGNHLEIWDRAQWDEHRREQRSRRDPSLWRFFVG